MHVHSCNIFPCHKPIITQSAGRGVRQERERVFICLCRMVHVPVVAFDYASPSLAPFLPSGIISVSQSSYSASRLLTSLLSSPNSHWHIISSLSFNYPNCCLYACFSILSVFLLVCMSVSVFLCSFLENGPTLLSQILPELSGIKPKIPSTSMSRKLHRLQFQCLKN